VQPVGATSTYKISVRTIAATNKNLEDLLSDGSFREDLYYRINVVNIHLPPLRERIEDIPKLADHFLRFFCEQNNRYIQDFEPQAMQLMLQYNWPGNVRELRSVVERLAIFVKGNKITVNDVAYVMSTSSSIPPNKSLTYNEAKIAFQKEFITQALIAHDWNVSAAAHTLDIDRTNLHKKMQQLGIQRNT
jgi:two-component system nitrogen regulation response regulator NtrX